MLVFALLSRLVQNLKTMYITTSSICFLMHHNHPSLVYDFSEIEKYNILKNRLGVNILHGRH